MKTQKVRKNEYRRLGLLFLSELRYFPQSVSFFDILFQSNGIISTLDSSDGMSCLCCTWSDHLLNRRSIRWESRRLGRKNYEKTSFYKKWAIPGLFFIYFCLFKHTLQILQQTGMWRNVHPLYGARIRTHDLWNINLLP